MQYTLAFVFDSFNNVALLLKNRPIGLAGKFNGIGGKVEPGEGIRAAALRELAEEADLEPTSFNHIGTYRETYFNIFVFYGFVHRLHVQSLTDEPVSIFQYTEAYALPNLDPHARAFLNLAYLNHTTADTSPFFISISNTFEDDGLGF
jgi:8-oxo-dGTP pyrophosphatase MutT (NUDIX family)